MEEMGLATVIQEIGVFSYEAELQPGLWENEIDHVFIGWYKGEDFQVNPTEVMDHGWFSFEELPKNLTVWFAPAFSLVKEYLEKLEAL
jgi:isopentenyl-diphosphate delta-isomerase